MENNQSVIKMYLLSLICTVTATPLGHPPFHQNLRSNRPKIQQLCIKTITALLLQGILTQLIPFTTDLKISVIYYIQKTHTQIRSLCHCFKKKELRKRLTLRPAGPGSPARPASPGGPRGPDAPLAPRAPGIPYEEETKRSKRNEGEASPHH